MEIPAIGWEPVVAVWAVVSLAVLQAHSVAKPMGWKPVVAPLQLLACYPPVMPATLVQHASFAWQPAFHEPYRKQKY